MSTFYANIKENKVYIHQRKEWPDWNWSLEAVFPLLSDIRYLQGQRFLPRKLPTGAWSLTLAPVGHILWNFPTGTCQCINRET